jgi:uncharacterized membrane protein YcaP (DUF421 family)
MREHGLEHFKEVKLATLEIDRKITSFLEIEILDKPNINGK